MTFFDRSTGRSGSRCPHRSAVEGVGRVDRDDVGYLHDVEQCRHPRHDVLPLDVGRGNEVSIAACKLDDERRYTGSASMCSTRRIASRTFLTPESFAA